MKAMIISFVCVLTFATQSLSAQNLTLEVRGIENVAGKLYVAIYNSMPSPCIRMRMEMVNWIPVLSVFLWRSLVSAMMPKALWVPLPTKNAVLPSLRIQL